MQPLAALPDRIDFAVATSGVVGTRFWQIDGRPIAPRGAEDKPAGFDLTAALAWCEQHGYTVRRWEGGARAWKGKPWPIRTREQILRKRGEVERQVFAGHAGGHLLTLDFALDM
jgi:hypothetical protein